MNPEARDQHYVSDSAHGSPSGPQEPSVLAISDTFTAVDGTAMNGRTPSPLTNGNNWGVIKGSFDINANRLRNTLASDSIVQVNPAATNYTVEFDVITPATIDATEFFGVIIRMSNGGITNGTMVYYDKSVAGGSYILAGGGENATPTYATLAEAIAINTTYHWKIVAIGATVQLYVDGVLKATGTGTTTANQYIAMIEFHTANTVRFDNFTVKE